MGGVEAYISAFEDALTSLEEVGEACSENFRKMTFLNGIVDPSYIALHEIFMEGDNKTYADCILAIRKKAIHREENKKGCHPVRRIASNLRTESQEEDVQVQQDVRYLPKELWESFSPEQKKCISSSLSR